MPLPRNRDCFLTSVGKSFSTRARRWIKMPGSHTLRKRARHARIADIIKFLSILRFLGEANVIFRPRLPGSPLPSANQKKRIFLPFLARLQVINTPLEQIATTIWHHARRPDDLITITYKNAQHVDPPLYYTHAPRSVRPSLLVRRISPADEWNLTSTGYWNFLDELYVNPAICKFQTSRQTNIWK